MVNRFTLHHLHWRVNELFTFAVVTLLGIAVGGLAWQTTLLCVLAVVSFWLGARQRALGLGLLAITIPVQAHMAVGIQTSEVTWTKVVVWGLLAGWACSLVYTRQRVSIDFITVAVFFLVAILALSVWNAQDGTYWMGETYRWLVTGIVSCFAFNAFRKGASPLPFLLGSSIGVAASLALAIWQVVAGMGPASFEVRGFMRTYGPFTHPNQLAMYLEHIGPMFLALAIGPRGCLPEDGWWYLSSRLRPFWVLGFGMTMVGLILSQSRGGLVGMIAGVLAVLALTRPGVRLSLVRFAPLGLVGATAFLTISIGIVASGVTSFSSGETLVTPGNFAVQERLSHWTAAVEMAKAKPLLGIGAGNFDENYRDFTQEWRFRIGRGHAHDTYLHFLAQSGVAGLTAYIALLLGVSLIIVRTLRILPNGSRLSLLIGVSGVTAAIGAHAVFEYVHVLSLNLQLVVIWAMAAAMGTAAWTERGSRS